MAAIHFFLEIEGSSTWYHLILYHPYCQESWDSYLSCLRKPSLPSCHNPFL